MGNNYKGILFLTDNANLQILNGIKNAKNVTYWHISCIVSKTAIKISP